MAEVPVEPTELFERALTTALSDPEPIVRIRAVEGLGRLGPLGEVALVALASAAVGDSEEEVRTAALAALDRLDDAVALIGSPAETTAHDTLKLSGKEGATGLLRAREQDLWLELSGLPASFENTKPVVALPDALAETTPDLVWSGERPGVVPAGAPVADGSLELRLGEIAPRPEPRRQFERVYLLNPDAKARSAA